MHLTEADLLISAYLRAGTIGNVTVDYGVKALQGIEEEMCSHLKFQSTV